MHIAFAAPTRLWRRTLDVPEGSTVGQALALSGFAAEFPEFTDHPPATDGGSDYLLSHGLVADASAGPVERG